MEVLRSGPDRPARGRAVPALLLALVVLLGAGDVAARQAERDRLARAVAQGSEAARYAERRVAATAEYAGPALTRASVGAAVRADLRALVRREARGQVAPLREAAAAVRSVRVLPWHGALREARTAYADSLSALADHLAGVEEDLARLYARPEELRASAARAREELSEVLPPERVARLLP